MRDGGKMREFIVRNLLFEVSFMKHLEGKRLPNMNSHPCANSPREMSTGMKVAILTMIR